MMNLLMSDYKIFPVTREQKMRHFWMPTLKELDIGYVHLLGTKIAVIGNASSHNTHIRFTVTLRQVKEGVDRRQLFHRRS